METPTRMDVRFALLLACFFGSGFAALLYQTAWTRELSFVFGTSELAVAAVLAAYMGGLALGAAAAARAAGRLRRPVLAYGLLELAIAVSALAVPAGIALVDAGYAALIGGARDWPETSAAATLLQLAGAFAVLLPPTAFMGATLPLLARHAVRRDDEVGSRVGVLYAVNTAGAIAGTLCAAFALIPALGLRGAVWVGAAVNGAVFALAALLGRGAPAPPEAAPAPVEATAAWILPAILLSGAVSFAYEVLWTRLLGQLVGSSLHAFAIMLASFLLGIALGGAAAAHIATTRERARAGFAVAQLGIAITSYAVFSAADRLPDTAEWLGASAGAPLASAALALTALLPITLCIGATFPFAVRWLALRPDLAARATARVYAWNTVGAIAGALGAGFALLPALGFAGTVAIGVGASALLAAGSAFAAHPRRLAMAAVAGAIGLGLAVVPPHAPHRLLLQSPLRRGAELGETVFMAVGRSSTVALLDQGSRWRLATNGLPEAVIDRAGVVPLPGSLSHWLCLLPVLLRPGARDMLVIGLGGGTAIESLPASVAAIDVVELEPEVVAANRLIADARARDPLADPRVRIHLGDARGALQLTAKRYDAIVSQPSHPWTAGASHLYTREFFALVRERLSPEGVFVQWIGLPYVDEALLRSLVATLGEVFGHVELYWPGERGVLFAASPAPLSSLPAAVRALRATPGDFARFGVYRLEDFASAWQLDEEGARAFASGSALNTDDRNELASRASRLGNRALDVGFLRRLVAGRDPLRAPAQGLDRGALLRSLAERGSEQRALDLARAEAGADRECAQGWVELGRSRPRNAARHFARARELSPDDSESLLGLVASRRSELARGPVPEIPERELAAPVAAVIAGWRAAARADWSAVAALDEDLAQHAPGDALYREAARLRAEWRLERGEQTAAADAAAILAAVLTSSWQGEEALLHARAAIAAGQSQVGWTALDRIADLAPPNERGRDLARRALALVDQLPEDAARRVRAALERRAKPPATRAGVRAR
ncbi:MAG TPA: fused MFS/spermidine synthase [Myxococcota bacterium]|nr:fused MFS/spermidine synthase [Myxococcota bacterium]